MNNIKNQDDCYFVINVTINKPEMRYLYDEYIQKVKPIVEKYGGEYIIRSENITPIIGISPDRIIMIHFDTRSAFERWFQSEEYAMIKHLRIESVSTQAMLVQNL